MSRKGPSSGQRSRILAEREVEPNKSVTNKRVRRHKAGVSQNFYSVYGLVDAEGRVSGRYREKRETKRERNLRVGLGAGGGTAYSGGHNGHRPHNKGWVPSHTMTVWDRESDHGLGHAQRATRQQWLDKHPVKKAKKKQ